MPLLSLLTWDSEFFQLKIGRLASIATPLDCIADIGKFDLVYWATHYKPIQYSEQYVVTQVHFNLSLEGTKSSTLSTNYETVAATVTELPKSPPSEELFKIGLEAGVHSRFRLDPHFSVNACNNLYREWVRKSTEHEIADHVFVALIKHKPVGIVTLSVNPPNSKIGLIAISSNHRRKGIARLLIDTAIERVSQYKNVRSVTVVTQEQNLSAIRLYRSCGFRLTDTVYWHHFWSSTAKSPVQNS